MKPNIKDFDYNLPKNLIAQKPVSPRHNSRLMVLDRKEKSVENIKFFDILNHLGKDDILVFNNTKVIPARLFGKKENTNGKVEILLLRKESLNKWICLVKPGLRVSQEIIFNKDLSAKVIESKDFERVLEFNKKGKQLENLIFKHGKMPVPPYIQTDLNNSQLKKKYQTIFAKHIGSSAAPTAGFHFSKELLEKLKQKGVKFEYITLHIGLGTFQPVKQENIKKNKLHQEWIEINKLTADRLNKYKKQAKKPCGAQGNTPQGKIIAVGTTSARALEAFSNKRGELSFGKKWTNIFIYPEYDFKFIDSLITNFHLPKSSLLMLVSALAGKDLIKKAYQLAIKLKYRFYSFGDAMWIK